MLAGVITQEQSDKVVALGGGLRHGVVSEQDIADAIAEEDARLAQEAVEAANYEAHMQQLDKWTEAYNSNIAPLMDSVEADPMVWAQAVQAIANNWSV